ncbi:MAG TPA: hypothetical protein VLG40_03500 [Candidatus Saccharimonas sp.]|nr:hypothetical protein [Candidatus Saccharimonas sp.]
MTLALHVQGGPNLDEIVASFRQRTLLPTPFAAKNGVRFTGIVHLLADTRFDDPLLLDNEDAYPPHFKNADLFIELSNVFVDANMVGELPEVAYLEYDSTNSKGIYRLFTEEEIRLLTPDHFAPELWRNIMNFDTSNPEQ